MTTRLNAPWEGNVKPSQKPSPTRMNPGCCLFLIYTICDIKNLQ